jgi:thiosulfate/3-mercaptopyruvate sulfurtransferase
LKHFILEHTNRETMMNYPWEVLRAAAAVLTLATFASSPTRAEEYANSHLLITTVQLADMLGDDDVRVLDVRPRSAYDAGHIPGALHLGADDVIDPTAHVDGARLPDAKLARMFGERGIDRDTRVVLYDDRGGFHAARLFWMLEYFGHRKVGILNGGVPRWIADGRKLSRENSKVQRADFTLTLTERRAADADWILERRNDANVVVIDVRPPQLHEKGHIPWAKSVPWAQNLEADGTMKPAGALRTHFASHGVVPEKNIAIHCQDGKAASHSYFTLRLLGYPRVRTYDRSWSEWGAADELPKRKPKS